MGSLSKKHIANLIVALQKRFNIENFVETGTYLGETTQWASNLFKRVFSIEASQKYFKISSDKLQNFQNITLHFGISTDVLPKIFKNLNGSSLFWLDAHWSAGDTFRGESECPLIQEIKIINSYSNDKFIFIDDAHMFLSPPPLPHNPVDWPTIDELIFVLQTSNTKSYLAIYDDVIISIPFYAKGLIEWYCRDLTNEDLLKTIEPQKFEKSFNTLYVIGAHKFQEYHILTEKFPSLKNIYLFEPLPHLQQFLKELEAKDPKIKVFPYAISNNNSIKTFFITNNDGQSSSLLNMGKHKEIFPHVKVISEIEVQVRKLETVIRENSLEPPDIIYLDTQGAEFLILSSIPTDILKNIKIIYTECSTDEIYEGSTHLNEIIKFLEPFFDFINFYPLTKNYPTHGDALFYNRNFLKKEESNKKQQGFISKRTHSFNTTLSKEKIVEHFGITKNEPLITIFIPVYNREKYLAETLNSLLKQTYKNFEIIIADDGSTDGTLTIAKKYAHIDSRIKVFSFPHRGEVYTRNDAIQKANPNTKYFMNHDSDDISLPNKLENLVKYLEEHPEIAIVGCFAEYFDDAGNHLGKPKIEYEPNKIRKSFCWVNSMINSATLIRKEVYEKIGYFRPEYASADDYDFFARALVAGFDLANLPEVLHKIRLHPNSISSQNAQKQQILAKKVQSEYQSQMAKSLPEQLKINKIYKPKTSQLNILHTVEFYYPHIGGSEIVIQNISEKLLQRGHLVTVATSKLTEREFSELNGVSIAEFDIEGKLSFGFRGREISKYLNFLSEKKFDVMLNYAAQQCLTDLAFLAIDEVQSKRVNCIATVGFSGLLNENQIRWLEFLGYYKNIIPQTLPKYDAVIAHSSNYQDYKFCKKINLKNLVVIPNGINADEFLGKSKIYFREKYHIQTKYIGLCVANFYPDKGHETLVKSFKLMNRNDFTLVLIGKEGEVLPKLKKMSEGLNILILENIPREDVVSAFQNADIFLFASKIEAFPLVLLEAMISKTPFVSTDAGNARELKGGIVCREDEISVYGNKILDDVNLRNQLAEEGFKECLTKYTWEKVVDQYEELYLRKYFEKFTNRKFWISASSLDDTKQFEIANTNPRQINKIVGVVFSKDRAMQLEAGIRSIVNCCVDFSSIDLVVLYKTSSANHQKQYELLINHFKSFQNIKFYQETSFKENLLSIMELYDFVLFLVDDNIFVRSFSILEVIDILNDNIDALGFSLRLGKNTTYCYMVDKSQEVPDYQVLNGYLKFNWVKSQYDFNYPLELSSSVYRVGDIWELLLNESYRTPNTLEHKLASSKKKFTLVKPNLCCFEISVAFCNPLNLVQADYSNRSHRNKWLTTDFLAQLFDYGYRINLKDFENFIPNSCHQEVDFKLDRASYLEPLISVIITCYNLGKYLPEAVSSVINQTFENWEIIIVDDGSQDNSYEVARELVHSFSTKQIIAVKNTNWGLATARNIGISISRGKYILPLDADDMIAPTFLEKTFDVLERSNEIDIAYTDTQEFENRNRIMPAGKFDHVNLSICNQLPYCSLFRRKVWEEVGGYNPNMKEGYEDWDFWIGAIEKGFQGQRIPEVLFFYRIRSNSMLSKAMKFDIKLKAQIVLNHQSLYSKTQIEWAKLVISKFPDVQGIPNQASFIPLFPDYSEKIKSKMRRKVNNNKNFLVSVIVLVKNNSVSLSRCIQSILDQTYQNFEIIVITDANQTLINNIESFKDKRIKHFINPENFRSNYHNFALSKANGTFIAYIDDSSIFYPNHLEILVNYLTNSNCKFAYTNAFRLFQQKMENAPPTQSKILHSFEFSRTKLLFENYIPICCVMHNKTLVEELGTFDAALPDSLEWDLWIRFSRKYPFKHINQVTCEFFDPINETTKSYNNSENKGDNKDIIYKKHKSFFFDDVQDSIANGKITEAEQILLKMMEIFDTTEHPEPLIDLGVIRSLQGRIEEAKSIFTQVLKLHPTNQIARENYELISEIL